MTESPIVSVEEGQLRGRLASTPDGTQYFSFQGIPYAKPPVGSLRFQAPQPAKPWNGVRDASTEGASSPQIDMFRNTNFMGDEDCLFLNVYSPKLQGQPLAVLVFIHGGAFRFGSGNSDIYGPDYLVEKGVVLVTLNYRLGPFGFLCLNTPEVPGNAGLKDVIAALRWVKKNIKQFGGNPDNITIFGESAGAVIVSMLTASPLTKDLIFKAIIQSGTCMQYSWAWQNHPVTNARAIAKALGFDSEDVDDILNFLRKSSAQEIAEAYDKLNSVSNHLYAQGYLCTPVIEKEFQNTDAVFTQPFIDLLNSGNVADIPIMIGTLDFEICFPPENDDLKYFIPSEFNIDRDSSEANAIADEIRKLYFKGQPISPENCYDYFDLISDLLFKVPTYRHVKCLVNVSSQPIYVYSFDYYGSWNFAKLLIPTPTNKDVKRAMHADDLFYLFRNSLNDSFEGNDKDKKTRERMVQMWTNFAKTANPTPVESNILNVTWAPMTKDNFYYLRITNDLTLDTDPEKERMEFWEKLYNKYYKIEEQPKSNMDDIQINSRAFKNLSLVKTNEDELDGEDSAEGSKDIGSVEPETKIINGAIKSRDGPVEDLPKNAGISKIVNYYDSLGSKQ